MISLWVTNCCNLQCKYCYVEQNKGNKFFAEENVEAFCDFVLSVTNGKHVRINFFGGEPLLAFDVIKKIVAGLEVRKVEDAVYFITTNGTLLTEEIASYLVNKSFAVSVSVDGKKETHDKNRVYKNGQGSYDEVEKGIAILKAAGCFNLRIRGTYDSEGVFALKENTEYLRNRFGNEVVMAPDYFDSCWNEEKFARLKEVAEYFGECDDISVIESAKTKATLCGGGVSDFYIDVNGGIYPCSYTVGENEYLLGNIKNGLNVEKIEEFRECNRQRIPECEGCGREYFCRSFKCKYLNKILTGNMYTPSPVICNLENIASSQMNCKGENQNGN